MVRENADSGHDRFSEAKFHLVNIGAFCDSILVNDLLDCSLEFRFDFVLLKRNVSLVHSVLIGLIQEFFLFFANFFFSNDDDQGKDGI